MLNHKWIVAYGRLSKEDLNKTSEYSNSIYHQLSFIQSYARNIGLTVDKEYTDDGYSGTNFDRPGFEQLKRDIEQGKIETIITKDMSRLGRNFLETVYYICEYFPKYNVRYLSINDQFDSENYDYNQQVILGIRSLINDRYVKDVSIKRKQVAISKTESGQFIGFIAPYGYRIKQIQDKRTLEIDDYAASIVRRIFTEISLGKTRKEVADGLNKDKIEPPILYMKMTPSKNKKYYYDWSDKTIYKILKNKTYTGKIVKRKSIKENYHQKKRNIIPIKDRETIDNCHPSIITDELFESANSKLKILKRKQKNNYCGPFKNLVACGECGNIMTTYRVQKAGKEEQYYFKCNKVINRHLCKNRNIMDLRLQAIVKEKLKDMIHDYVDQKKIVSKVTKNLLQKERPNWKIDCLKDKIDFHNTNIKNLYLKKTKGEITTAEFTQKKAYEMRLQMQSEQLLNKIVKLNNEKVRTDAVLQKYHEFLKDGILTNEMMKNLIDKIVVYQDHTLKLSFQFRLESLNDSN